jgi:hypothetical protein
MPRLNSAHTACLRPLLQPAVMSLGDNGDSLAHDIGHVADHAATVALALP